MLKAKGAAEKAIWGLVRWAIALGGPARRIGEAVVDELRPSPREAVPESQLALWVADADGLPERPWRVLGSAQIGCLRLGCTTTAHECVFRQMVSARQRTRDSWRGQSSEYPSCVSARCPQGAGVRAALAPSDLQACEAEARAAAKSRDHDRPQAEKRRQERAQRRQERVGMLDEAPTIDAKLEPVPE